MSECSDEPKAHTDSENEAEPLVEEAEGAVAVEKGCSACFLNLRCSISDKDDGEKKTKAVRKRNRGKHMTPEKRVAQYPQVFVVRGEVMWCKACECKVGFEDNSTAKAHLQSKTHKKNVQKAFDKVMTPGFTAKVEPESQPSQQSQQSQPAPKKQKTADLKDILDGQTEKEKITDDFVAAFLHAGLPPPPQTGPPLHKGVAGQVHPCGRDAAPRDVVVQKC